jgi:hypothetical protein
VLRLRCLTDAPTVLEKVIKVSFVRFGAHTQKIQISTARHLLDNAENCIQAWDTIFTISSDVR